MIYILEKEFFAAVTTVTTRFVRRFFSDRVKRFVVYFGLYESSLPFSRREDQINTLNRK